MRLSPRLAACCLLILSWSAFAAEQEIVVNIQKSGDGFVVDGTLDIPVPLRTAWDVVTDFDNMAGILSNLTSSKVIRRNGNTLYVAQEGAARFGFFTYAFTSERKIRLDPMKRIIARQITGTAKRFESEMELLPSDRGTALRYHAEIVPDSGIARTFGGSFIAHEIEEQLSTLAAEMLRRKSR
jgi:carbon monoxide dehydrogenase subunit G